jgi:O-antigen ligase
MPFNRLFAVALIFVAAVLPFQIAWVLLPSPTFANEVIAILGWGGLLIGAGRMLTPGRHTRALQLAGIAGFVLLLTISTHVLTGLVFNPTTGLIWTFYIASAGACLVLAYAFASDSRRDQWIDWFAWCWLAGGSLAVAAELLQYLQISTNPFFISPLNTPGRMYGNIRQPNHLATFLATCIVGTGWLHYRGRLSILSATLGVATLSAGVVLTSSRTGLLVLAVLFLIAVWLTRHITNLRRRIWLFPVWIVGLNSALISLDKAKILPFFGAERTGSTIIRIAENTGSRIELWTNSMFLIRENWLFGVGFGQFQFHYLLSDVPVEFPIPFNNAHSLPLHLAVEFGLPVTVLILGLLAAAFFSARSALKSPAGLFAVLLLIPVGFHSLFEFPLWYAYFLFPSAAAFGLYLGMSADQPAKRIMLEAGKEKNAPPESTGSKFFLFAGMAIISLVLVALTHYLALAAIYKPGGTGDSFEERMETSRKAFLYAPWVKHSLLTSNRMESATPERWRQLVPLFDKAARFYMDDIFLYRYTVALTYSGDLERAKRTANALGLMQSPFIFKLLEYCQARPESEFKALAAFVSNPVHMTRSAKNFSAQ